MPPNVERSTVDHPVDVGVTAKIARHEQTRARRSRLLASFCAFFVLDVGEYDLRAGRRERLHETRADAARAAGDHRNAVLDTLHGRSAIR